jgi:hypothetical protein
MTFQWSPISREGDGQGGVSAGFYRRMDLDIEWFRGYIVVWRECGGRGGSTEAECDLDVFGLMAGE